MSQKNSNSLPENSISDNGDDPASDTGGVPDLIPKQGERAFIAGQTGSGKTQFVIWLLERLKNSPIVIYDTKDEAAFNTLPRSRIVRSTLMLATAINDPQVDYIVFKVPPQLTADGEALDQLLWTHFTQYQGCDVYIDEVYSFSSRGNAGPGLVALLTQGRSKGITTLMSAQRPQWISRFILTETQRFYIFYLNDRRDKVALSNVISDFDELPDPPEFQFYYYRVGKREPPRLMERIVLDKQKAGEYKDPTHFDTPDAGTALNWV